MATDPTSLIVARLTSAAGSGGRLPPERRIAADLGLSRAEVRKTLALLEAQGRIVRQVGRGTFLRHAVEGSEAWRDITLRTSPREAMQARLLIEPELAGLAAVNATAEQIEALRGLTAQMRAAADWAAYERLDGSFHRLAAEAAGNKLLLAVHDIVNEVRRAVIWGWLDTRPAGPPADYSSFGEHEAIVEAIARRDRADAAHAMRRHLRTTNTRLIGVD